MFETVFQKVLLVVGLLVLAVAMRSFGVTVLRKLAILVVLAASYVAAFFLFGSHFAGVAAVLAWFFLPWVELLTRIRKLRLPLSKKLEHKSPPPPQRFPSLEELTTEIEEDGFEYVDDAGWEWDGMEQFFRILYHPDERLVTTICLNEQNEIGFVHLTISCRDDEGIIWRTWDYPFSYSLHSAPELRLNRVDSVQTFGELKRAHESFLEEHGVEREHLVREDLEHLHQSMEDEIRAQIDHNLSRGIIRESGEGTFRYSWRGLMFLWAQFLKDMVKLF